MKLVGDGAYKGYLSSKSPHQATASGAMEQPRQGMPKVAAPWEGGTGKGSGISSPCE
jgi:hypothetical protein